MIQKLFPLLLLNVLIWGCRENAEKESTNHLIQTSYSDSLKANTDNIRVLFYTDFLKSKVMILAPSWPRKAEVDSTMQLIRFEQLSDTCSLQSNVIPAGHLQFYRDTVLLDELEFVLEGDCKGLYSDFTRTPRKYKLTVGLEKKLNELDPLKQVNNK